MNQARPYSYIVENDKHSGHPDLLALTVRIAPESTKDVRVYEVQQDDYYFYLTLNGAHGLLQAIMALDEQE